MRQARFRRIAFRIVLVATMLGATLVYGTLEKSVVVRIEGQIKRVRTFASTVGDTLDRAGIPLGEQDRIVPSIHAGVRDGLVIKIWRAKPITIILNGQPREVIVTSSTIDDLLREVRLRSSVKDYVGASRSARVYPGMRLEYRQAVAVIVVHDDRTERVITNLPNVRLLLSDLGIKIGPKDKVIPGLGVYPRNKMTVRVLRVGLRREDVQRSIPAPVQHRKTLNQEYGTTRVLTQGLLGLKVFRYLSTYVDGRRVKHKLLGVSTVRKPKPKIIAIGAGFPGCVCKTGTESGGATWYEANGLTAAHKTLPFGTVVRVTNLANGKSVNVVIRDRGPYAKGKIIDLSANAFGRIAKLSTGVINVKIRW